MEQPPSLTQIHTQEQRSGKRQIGIPSGWSKITATRCPPAASEHRFSFSFELAYLGQVSLAWGNRRGLRGGPCIGVFGLRQGVVDAAPKAIFTSAGDRAEIGRLRRAFGDNVPAR